MEDLFRSYWWLLFPLAFFIAGGWNTWLAYRNRRQELEILRSLAEQGKEVPPELLKRLNREPEDFGDDMFGDGSGSHRRYRGHPSHWTSVFVFGAIAAGFGWGAYTFPSDSAATVFMMVAIVMGVMCGGFLLMALAQTMNRPK